VSGLRKVAFCMLKEGKIGSSLIYVFSACALGDDKAQKVVVTGDWFVNVNWENQQSSIDLLLNLLCDAGIKWAQYAIAIRLRKSGSPVSQWLPIMQAASKDNYEGRGSSGCGFEPAKCFIARMLFEGAYGSPIAIDKSLCLIRQLKSVSLRARTIVDILKMVDIWEKNNDSPGKHILDSLLAQKTERGELKDSGYFRTSYYLRTKGWICVVDIPFFNRVLADAKQTYKYKDDSAAVKNFCASICKESRDEMHFSCFSSDTIQLNFGYDNVDLVDFLVAKISVEGRCVVFHTGFATLREGTKNPYRHATPTEKDARVLLLFLEHLRTSILCTRRMGAVKIDGSLVTKDSIEAAVSDLAAVNGDINSANKQRENEIKRCEREEDRRIEQLSKKKAQAVHEAVLKIRKTGKWNKKELFALMVSSDATFYQLGEEECKEAHYYLGRMLCDGVVCIKDSYVAGYHLEKAGTPKSLLLAGKMYLAGIHSPVDVKAATRAFKLAADAGNASARRELERLAKNVDSGKVRDGIVSQHEKETSVRWFKRPLALLKFSFVLVIVGASLCLAASFIGSSSVPEKIRPAVERLSVAGMQIRDAASGRVPRVSKDATVSTDATPAEENVESSAAPDTEPVAKKLPITGSQVKYGLVFALIVTLLAIFRKSGMAEGGFVPFVGRASVLGWCLYKVGEMAIAAHLYSTSAVMLAVIGWVLLNVCRGRSRCGWWRWLIMAGCFGAGLSGLQSAGIAGAVVLLLGPARIK